MLFKTKPIAYSMALAFGGLSALGAAQAQQAEQAGTQQRLERVEVTGSSIRRADVETVVPISVFPRDDLQPSGATTRRISSAVSGRLASRSGAGTTRAFTRFPAYGNRGSSQCATDTVPYRPAAWMG